MKHIPNTKYKIRNTNPGGFSMLEVMVSIFLIVVGMIGAISLISSSLRNSLDSRNQAIAGLLAQEGVELVRNIRDNNWAQAAVSFANFPGTSPAICRIDSVNNSVNGVNRLQCAGESKILRYNSTNRKYEHLSGTNTKFSRQVVISNGATIDERTIVSKVIWSGSSFPSDANCNTANRCSYASAILTKWGE